MTTEYYGYRNGHSLNTGAAQYRHKARKVREERAMVGCFGIFYAFHCVL